MRHHGHELLNLKHLLLYVPSPERLLNPVTLDDPIPEKTARVFHLATFTPHVGGEFTVLRGREWVTVSLAEAKPVGGHRPIVCEKFSLIFAAGREEPLQQGIHEFRHEVLGPFELFITPVMSSHSDMSWYEASINRETAP